MKVNDCFIDPREHRIYPVETGNLSFAFPESDSASYDMGQFGKLEFGIADFSDIIIRTIVKGLVKVVITVHTGKNDTGGFGKFLADKFQQRNTVMFPHLIIGNDCVKGVGFQELEGFIKRQGCIYTDIIVALQETLAGIQKDSVVVNIQDRYHSNPLQQIKASGIFTFCGMS
jgi:hypothetical protein